MIKLAMFDMAGTTVDDVVDGHPLVIGATLRALARHGLSLTPRQVSAQRGREKRGMLRTLIHEAGGDEQVLDDVYDAFLETLNANLEGVREMPGARETFAFLRERDVRVGVGSGFPADVVARLVEILGWRDQGLVDYSSSAQEVGEGRPSAAMIRDAMAKLGVDDPRDVVKVGDTAMDVLEGRNAGVWTVAVLSGTQGRERLAEGEPDAILPGVGELPSWLIASGLI